MWSGTYSRPYFGRDDDVITLGELAQSAPQDLFAMPGGVRVGRVEEVDPGLDSLADNRHAFMLGKRPRLAAPRRVAEPCTRPGQAAIPAGRSRRAIHTPPRHGSDVPGRTSPLPVRTVDIQTSR